MSDATIYLVDDNAEFRQSAAWWLSGEGYEVRVFSGPEEALTQLMASPMPTTRACLLLDVRMPGMSGPDLHSRLIEHGIAGEGRGLPVIYMTGHGDVPLAVEAMQKGAITFLEKPLQHEALSRALERALAASECQMEPGEPPGNAVSLAPLSSASSESPSSTESSVEPLSPQHAAYRQRFESLTPRERQVLEGLLQGEINKQIARRIGISPKTVELHRAKLMGKFQAKNLTHLVLMATTQRVDDEDLGDGREAVASCAGQGLSAEVSVLGRASARPAALASAARSL